MANKLSKRYQIAIWNWTWKRLLEGRLQDIEERFGKEFTEWMLKEKNNLTDEQGAGEEIPIYTGSLSEVVSLIDKDIIDLHIIINDIINGENPYGSYVHRQSMPSDTWMVHHELGYYPSVTVVDRYGVEFECFVQHVDKDNAILKFMGGFSGKAYLS